MSLIITFMFEPAKLQMNCARASGTSTPRSVLDVRPAASASVTRVASFCLVELPAGGDGRGGQYEV
ncbi:hypothetical protein [Embleya sp. NPDC005575]|uniref:hypothetical protein n=1 Tax=Embleya sp. NPDC005575 TaxID=3156892 RepID=UPI0033B3805E